MTVSVVPYQRRELAERSWVALMAPAVELAKAVSNTDFVPKTLRGNPAAITAAILYGDEVGLGPMQSLAKIAVVDGKPTLYAEAQRALILSAGHDLWIEEATTTRVILAGRRANSDQTSRVTWTMDDAKRAGLSGKPNWRQYPRQMLLARATAELARAVFADAIGGLAATEELEETSVPSDAAIPATPATSTKRKRKDRTPAVTTSAPPEPEPATPQQPPLPGEQPDEDAMSDPQRRKLMALFRERGFSERAQRLSFSTVALGRRITSANELTSAEASTLISALEQRPTQQPAEGEADWGGYGEE